jgi:hypothetical protein
MRRNPDGSFSWLILRKDWIFAIVSPSDVWEVELNKVAAGLSPAALAAIGEDL